MSRKAPFNQFKKSYGKWRAQTWPAVVEAICVNFFQKSFDRQGFLDKSLERWPARKDGSDPGRAILIKRGYLRRSIRGKSRTPSAVTIKAGDLNSPYASIHNEGGTINHPGGTPYIITKKGPTFIRKTTAARLSKRGLNVRFTRPHKIDMPKRQFMGDSAALMDEVEKAFFEEMQKLV
ncbi:MAG: phage virion morphogenesis protein [Bacteroidota bacterium]